jgi:hypothetical protein
MRAEVYNITQTVYIIDCRGPERNNTAKLVRKTSLAIRLVKILANYKKCVMPIEQL